MKLRVGQGYDVHRLCEGRDLIIGGVNIPYSKGLLGHSDADVLVHAVIDALIGAAALGDIGALFPDSDEKYRGACSINLLEETVALLKDKGYVLVNIDSTVVAQAPKLAPYKEERRRKIADAAGIDISDVSVKAKTEEGLGFTGDGSGIAAQAVCLISSLK